jgi:peroxiredoxin Q/BCP
MLRLLCAGVFLVAGMVSYTFAAETIKVGDPAPNFEMTGSDGKVYKLADFKDKQAVVVAWYPKAFTGGCTKECKSFKADGEKMRAFNVAYFTASCDTVQKNTDFAKSLDADYAILSDPDGKVATAYGIYNADKKFSNRVTFYIGKDGKILAIDSAVKTDSHGADVAAKLKELGVEAKK